MPIRFRCAYCNQLMGISNRKAGTVVRCPKCAGEIIVPTPAGADAPVEAPEPQVFADQLINPIINEAANGQGAASTENGAADVLPTPAAPPPTPPPKRRGLFLPMGMVIVSMVVVILLLILVFILGVIIGKQTGTS